MRSVSRHANAVMQFAHIGPEVWRLDGAICGARRRWLLQPPDYDEIIKRLLRDVSLEVARCQRAKGSAKAYRVVAKLRTTPLAIDLFHNSVAGYRAQYLSGASVGEAANAHALSALLPAVVPLLLQRRPNFPSVVLEQSLSHPWTKIWIHQGLWLRHARREEQVLQVPSWAARATSNEPRVKKLVRWGSLAPETEQSFVIKGGFVFLDGSHRLGEPPKNRAEDIHTCGFT